MRVWSGSSAIVAIILTASSAVAAPAAPSPGRVIARTDLSKPFHLPPGASFTATQGPPATDPIGLEQQVPGQIHLCVRSSTSGSCSPVLDNGLAFAEPPDLYSTIHFLDLAELVYPRGAASAPLLHLQFGSLHSVDNGQRRAVDMLAYRTTEHRFEIVFHEQFGHNHNEEVRYIASGPLRGDIISASPTENAPYGYWVTVNRLTPSYHYRQVLRYRSATHYNDGNRLAVIDSEMPNILRRLGLWRPGEPLPLPRSGCADPRLVKTELWCS
jgi:hypothetical protein